MFLLLLFIQRGTLVSKIHFILVNDAAVLISLCSQVAFSVPWKSFNTALIDTVQFRAAANLIFQSIIFYD